MLGNFSRVSSISRFILLSCAPGAYLHIIINLREYNRSDVKMGALFDIVGLIYGLMFIIFVVSNVWGLE